MKSGKYCGSVDKVSTVDSPLMNTSTDLEDGHLGRKDA